MDMDMLYSTQTKLRKRKIHFKIILTVPGKSIGNKGILQTNFE